MSDFSDYDHFYRAGVFDACNGKPAQYNRDESDIAICGYFDGYDGNDNQFPDLEPEPTGSTFDTQQVFKLWIEGDWGQDYYIFGSEASAKAKATELIQAQASGEPDEWTCYEDAEAEGLAGIEPLVFIP